MTSLASFSPEFASILFMANLPSTHKRIRTWEEAKLGEAISSPSNAKRVRANQPSLLDLPIEVLLNVICQLKSIQDVIRFLTTCRTLNNILQVREAELERKKICHSYTDLESTKKDVSFWKDFSRIHLGPPCRPIDSLGQWRRYATRKFDLPEANRVVYSDTLNLLLRGKDCQAESKLLTVDFYPSCRDQALRSLEFAIINGCPKLGKRCMPFLAHKQLYANFWPLVLSCWWSLGWFLEAGADPNSTVRGQHSKYLSNAHMLCDSWQEVAPIFIAILHRYPKAVKILLEAGVNLDLNLDCLGTPLICAITHKCHQELKIMLSDSRVSRDATLLLNHALRYSPECVNVLLTVESISPNHLVPSFNSNGPCEFTLLYYCAVYSRHAKNLSLVLDLGADPNECRPNHPPPLFGAVSYNHFKAAQILLSRGANPNFVDHQGYTPLTQLSSDYEKAIKMIDLLVSHGADVNFAPPKGHTPLSFATYLNRKPDIVRHFLSIPGIQVDAVSDFDDMESATALHVAASRGKLEFARLLVQAGANVEAKLLDGRTPRDLVSTQTSKNYLELLQLLK